MARHWSQPRCLVVSEHFRTVLGVPAPTLCLYDARRKPESDRAALPRGCRGEGKDAAVRNAAAAASLLEGLGVSTSSFGTDSHGSNGAGAAAGVSKGKGERRRRRSSGKQRQWRCSRASSAVTPDDIEALKMLLRVRLEAGRTVPASAWRW